jgi:hypothetical protein
VKSKKYENLPPLTDAQLRAIAEMEPPAGYPKERLRIEPEKWAKMVREDRIIIPRTPGALWRVDTHPNRTNAPENSRHLIQPSVHEQPITREQIDGWRALGLRTDHETGEAIHYHAAQIITTVGMYGGLGFLFQHGPQGVAAAVVRRDPHPGGAGQEGQYAIIRREDNQMWALPVGFREPGEPPEIAAPRECEEETGSIADWWADWPWPRMSSTP